MQQIPHLLYLSYWRRVNIVHKYVGEIDEIVGWTTVGETRWVNLVSMKWRVDEAIADEMIVDEW